MPIKVTMPALSPTMEEGNLAKWMVKEGDSVAPGDVIAEIETDKATMEVEAVDEGTVAKLVVPEGTEGVKVNALIAVLAEEGEDAGEAAKAAESGSDSKPESKVESKAEKPAKEEAPAAKSEAKPAEAKAAPAGDGERVFASPLARRLAKEAGLDLSAIAGSGPKGRIVKADVEAAGKDGGAKAVAAGAPAEAASAAPSAPQAMSDDQVMKLFEEGSYELIPHDSMRKTIARRLVEAKSTIPHFYLTLDCEIDALLALRKQLNDAAPKVKTGDGEKPAYKLSVNDMVIKAHAKALTMVPEANVSWTESAMVKHRHADVGVAVSIPGGLITPIIRRADEKTLSAISN
ncbi:MAG: 2-oxo acid dehydrogenase subunit E2, partial [Pseudomonadota bacterium]|nr:2-oxo acid dehydrogenase subunit E2 [Pseudomonadota bacterium]